MGLLLAIGYYGWVDLTGLVVPETLPELAMLVGSEVVVGVIMGFTVGIVFHAVRFSGQVVGYQMGFAIGRVFDPLSRIQVPIVGQVLFTLSILLYLALDGHHMALRGLHASFVAIPVGAAVFPGALFGDLVRVSAGLFKSAVLLTAPVFVTLLLVTVSLGIMARLMPQLHIFFVAHPLKIAVGLAMIFVSIPFVTRLLHRLFSQSGADLERMLIHMSGA
jgi:flagellar biosynthetic protein FliR